MRTGNYKAEGYRLRDSDARSIPAPPLKAGGDGQRRGVVG